MNKWKTEEFTSKNISDTFKERHITCTSLMKKDAVCNQKASRDPACRRNSVHNCVGTECISHHTQC